jgi:hypothetical protein
LNNNHSVIDDNATKKHFNQFSNPNENLNNFNSSNNNCNQISICPGNNEQLSFQKENEYEKLNCNNDINIINNDNNNNNLNSNLDGSFGFSGNSVLTSNNPHLNLHNRMIPDNSNFNLNELPDKYNKEDYLEMQSNLSGNNIFLNNLIKNNNNKNNNISSRNDFAKDEKILFCLFSVIDSKFCLGIFKKFNLNFYDFLNITKDELTEFKVPIKEKIRVLKLNLNLKKFLEEKINEDDFTAFAQNTSEVNNMNMIIEFFKQNKFLVYNQKILDGFFTDNSFKYDGEQLNNFFDKSRKDNYYNSNMQNIGKYDNSPNIDEEKNAESNYVTTPNFRNISNRRNNGNAVTNNVSTKNNITDDFNKENLCDSQINHNVNCNDFNYKPKNNTIYYKYNNDSTKNVIYNNSIRKNNNLQSADHDKEIIELLKNKEIKSNSIYAEPAYKAKKGNFDQNNLTNLDLNKDVSDYESFLNEYEKIQNFNNNYKEAFSNTNSFVGNKLSEFGNDPNSECFVDNNDNNYNNVNRNFNFNESGNAFTNKLKNVSDNSSIKTKNLESNKDNTSFKISNFSIISKKNNINKIIQNNNFNNSIANNNENNEEYDIGCAEKNNSNYVNDEIPVNLEIKTKSKNAFKKENQNINSFQNNQIIENHQNLYRQKKLLDKLIDNKTKSKIKFKKNSTRYVNNSSEISKIVNNYLSEFKELKQRSENRQIKFSRLVKNCNRQQNYNSDLIQNYCVKDGNMTEKTNSDDREELFLNRELNDLLNELQIYSDNFKVSEENINKLKRIKEIIDSLKAKNSNFEFDLDFNVEELEKQIVNQLINKFFFILKIGIGKN